MENRRFGKSALWWLPALLLAAFMVIALPGIARADYAYYEFTNGTLWLDTETGMLTSASGSFTSYTVPGSITYNGKTYTVKGVGGAFTGNTKLKNITLPSSVKTIYNGDFSGCRSLTKITMPGVTVIEDGAFSN